MMSRSTIPDINIIVVFVFEHDAQLINIIDEKIIGLLLSTMSMATAKQMLYPKFKDRDGFDSRFESDLINMTQGGSTSEHVTTHHEDFR